MKSLSLCLFLFIQLAGISQSNEFQLHENGLIYNPTTMKQLKFIVDSLNIKYKSCDLDKVYYSNYQTKAHYVSLEKVGVRAAIKDIENHISYEDFKKKYPSAKTDTSLVVLKRKYKTYNKKVVVEFESLIRQHDIVIRNDSSIYDKPIKGKWIVDNRKDSDYRKNSIQAFYFPMEFEKQPLPDKYARMIQYSDCMVDTTTQIFTKDALSNRFHSQLPNKLGAFMTLIHDKTQMPVYNLEVNEDGDYDEEKYEEYFKKDSVWQFNRFKIIEETLLKDVEFNNLFHNAVQEALETKISNDEFEDYVERYYSKKTALDLKRNRIVIGRCSQDDSPRIHAMNIAKLSALTVNWETFLRAHLNIMNDRFDRMSDGSYAQAGRKTYIKELEELDIDVTSLLLGISLRIDNPSPNHYFGSINRLGRALSETKYTEEIETEMLNMIADNQLDDYNRVCIYFLFKNYNYYLNDEAKKMENETILKAAIDKHQSHLFAALNKED